MTNNINKKQEIENFLDNIPSETKYFVKHAMDFAVSLSVYLEKNNWTQRDFSDLMGKEESEISKWLSGNHNFTLKSIAKIEAVLNDQLIFTREEISKRFLPYIFRQLKSLNNEDYFNQLIAYYCLSEVIDKEISIISLEGSNYNLTDSKKSTGGKVLASQSEFVDPDNITTPQAA